VIYERYGRARDEAELVHPAHMVEPMLGTRAVVGRWGARQMALCVAWLALLTAAAVPVAAAGDGADISYPGCGSRAYPVAQAFGIVGVNGGRPDDANRCLASELSWALGSVGFDFEFGPPASLYVNTADPGPGTRAHPVAGWPRSGISAHGVCRGRWSSPCAYLYGRQHAAHAFGLVAEVDGPFGGLWSWWLDVERANSWAKRGTPGFSGLNVATIQGFIDGLRAAGVRGAVGIYSTPADWVAITGLSAEMSRSYFPTEPDWVGGATTRLQALGNCRLSFSGGRVLLTQYVAGLFDVDVRCL
jgi:hypothetical protein